MLAVNHKIALPSFEDLSAIGFDLDSIPRDRWAVADHTSLKHVYSTLNKKQA
jgi:hypothetical protein